MCIERVNNPNIVYEFKLLNLEFQASLHTMMLLASKGQYYGDPYSWAALRHVSLFLWY
jgi:hypothetical protein